MSLPQSREDRILAEARNRPPAERAAFLDGACLGDDAVRQRVESRLGSEPQRDTTADTSPDAERATVKVSLAEAAAEAEGQSLGRYKLLERIGEGGFGVVYVAEQKEPVKRRVALKIIKLGMDTRQVVARFEAERQALALMDHPNIAKVLDAGATNSGRPYFVMELVRGVKINDYCDQHKLSTGQRLELFIPVCQAIQHAHQKGIIHRDIKPSNILVTLHDGVPVPKVIDFGIAKATQMELTDKTLYTQLQQFVGTPAYMSPEQAEMSGLDVDTRSDIYSLGVLLYELLTGHTPFDPKELAKSGIDAMRRTIREKEPVRPSTRLHALAAEELTTTAKHRGVDVSKLVSQVRGDLDWIVMKCLEKDRTRRYETANALGTDIQRCMAARPVIARAPSASYLFGKFVRRNKGPVFAAALLLLALLGGIAGTTWGLVTAREALHGEKRQRDIAQRSANEREQARVAAERALYANRVNLAAQYWRGDNLTQSRRILDFCPPQMRGWEWRYLDRLHRADLRTFSTKGRAATALQVRNKEGRFAAFFPVGVIRIWNPDRGDSFVEINSNEGPRFTCCALAPTGRIIALGDKSGDISLRDTETGQVVREFTKLRSSVGSVSFSPDGKWLAAAGAEERNGENLFPALEPPRNEDLVVWEVATGAEVFHPTGFGFAVEFNPDGSRLLAYKLNTAPRPTPQIPETFVALFDTSNWTEVNPGSLGSADAFAFSSTGGRLALAGFDRITNTPFLRIFESSTGRELRALAPAPMGTVLDIAFSPDGSMLAVCKSWGFTTIQLWDVNTWLQLRTLRGHTDRVNSITFAADGRLLSCSWDQTIKIWDPVFDPEVQVVAAASGAYAIPALLTPGGQMLVFAESASVDLQGRSIPAISVVDLKTPDHEFSAASNSAASRNPASDIRTVEGPSAGTAALAVSNDGRRLACGGRTGDVRIWDLATLKEIAGFHRYSGVVSALALSPDGRHVAVAYRPPGEWRPAVNEAPIPPMAVPNTITVSDTESGSEEFTIPGPGGRVDQLAFSPDGRWLASTTQQGARICDAASGKSARELKQSELRSGTADALVFNAAANLLATAGNNTVQLWDVATGHSMAVFQGHGPGKLSVALNPDGSRLATAAGQQVKVWDTHSGLEFLTLPLPQVNDRNGPADVVALAWSGDGQKLRAALRNGSIAQWDGATLSEPKTK